MTNCSRNRGRPMPAQPPAAPVPAEPPVHRWPHPVEGVSPSRQPDPMLHYIRCALSYQNQLLAEIKALLQDLAESSRET